VKRIRDLAGPASTPSQTPPQTDTPQQPLHTPASALQTPQTQIPVQQSPLLPLFIPSITVPPPAAATESTARSKMTADDSQDSPERKRRVTESDWEERDKLSPAANQRDPIVELLANIVNEVMAMRTEAIDAKVVASAISSCKAIASGQEYVALYEELYALRVVISIKRRLAEKPEHITAREVALTRRANNAVQTRGHNILDGESLGRLDRIGADLAEKELALNTIVAEFEEPAAKSVSAALAEFGISSAPRDHSAAIPKNADANPALLTKLETLLDIKVRLYKNQAIRGEEALAVLLLLGQLRPLLRDKERIDLLLTERDRERLRQVDVDFRQAAAEEAALKLASDICSQIMRSGSLPAFLNGPAKGPYQRYFVHKLTANWSGYLSANLTEASYKEASGQRRVIFTQDGREVHISDDHYKSAKRLR